MTDEKKNSPKKSISLPLANPEKTVDEPAAQAPQGDDVQSRIAREVGENQIVIYMKGVPQQPMCGFSARASAILASYGKPFLAVNILEDAEKRQGIKDFSNWPTIPQIYVSGDFLGGSDILMQLHEKGELGAVIEEAFTD